MKKIHIHFNYKDKEYFGTLSRVPGAGSNTTYHLMIDRYYYGQLFYTKWGWQFASNKDHFEGMAEYFGNYLIAWTDSNTDDKEDHYD